MNHIPREAMDRFLDGRTGFLRRLQMNRHLAQCPQCRELKAACEADRLFLEEVTMSVEAFSKFEKEIPPSMITPPAC